MAKKYYLMPRPTPQNPPQGQSQTLIGPPAPQKTNQDPNLPQHWTKHHIDIYKDMKREPPVVTYRTLLKYLRLKKAGDKDTPAKVIDTIIEVAKYVLENEHGMTSVEDRIKKFLAENKP